MKKVNNIVWFRRDLRLHDHRALSEALKTKKDTLCVFIFDPKILESLPKNDRRITFIIESLEEMEKQLRKVGSSLLIEIGDPKNILEYIFKKYQAKNLFYNRDYEPYAKKRDSAVEKMIKRENGQIFSFKDHVFYEKHEVLTQSREVYKVFTPYKNKWLEIFTFQEKIIPLYKTEAHFFVQCKPLNDILENDFHKKIGFNRMSDNLLKGGSLHGLKRLNCFADDIADYDVNRNLPALNKTSNLSVYIRHGNISIRDMIRAALAHKNQGAKTWLSEIIWRDFYQMILDVYPKVEKECFKTKYNQLKWNRDQKLFALWCKGKTGYPIVDSAMRCLNETGMMNNRLRMIVASFLCKTLLLDWKLGEKYFAEKLFDFDLAANNGGWQWCASTGVDAQPYFRIFNPYSQSEKFDPEGNFIKEWCPELKHFSKKLIHSPHDANTAEQAKAKCIIGMDYPGPVVSYKVNREKALSLYKAIKTDDEA